MYFLYERGLIYPLSEQSLLLWNLYKSLYLWKNLFRGCIKFRLPIYKRPTECLLCTEGLWRVIYLHNIFSLKTIYWRLFLYGSPIESVLSLENLLKIFICSKLKEDLFSEDKLCRNCIFFLKNSSINCLFIEELRKILISIRVIET